MSILCYCCRKQRERKKKKTKKRYFLFFFFFFISTTIESRESKDAVCFAVCKKKTVAPVCKHVLNSAGGWRYQNATPPPLNVPEEVHGALKHETIGLVCEVEANPTTVTFHWTFNSSGDLADIPSAKYTNEGTSSKLNYTPSSDMDYGTLGCWASNAVGPSKQPCLYQVIAAGSSFTISSLPTQNLPRYYYRSTRPADNFPN